MSAPVEVSATHDEWGTTIRIYVGGVLREDYYAPTEQGNWRRGLPPHDRLTEHRQ